MSQHDLSIANQGFPAFRSDLNDALQALGSMQSGTSAPSTTFANMLWYDTTNNIVKMRNEDNDAWISLLTLDQSGDLISEISAGKFIGTDTTDASSTTAAAVKTAGGLAVAKKLYVGTGGAVVEGLTVGKGAGAVSTNTAVGASALAANTTGNSGAALGYQAGYTNSTGSDFTYVGYQAGYTATGDNNTYLGAAAGKLTSTGVSNTGLGSVAGYSTTTGSYNVSVGRQALFSNTTASNNTAVGYQAGYSNTTGYSNTLIGFPAGYSLTTGYLNTFVGKDSGYYVTTGAKNSILGAYNGNQGGLDIRTASNYIVLSDGDGNPRGVFDSSGNLLVGTTSQIYSGFLSISCDQASRNGIVINDTNASAGNNNPIIFRRNGSVVGSVATTTSATSYVTSSDYRLKENIATMTGALSVVQQLNPVTYTWKSNGEATQGFIAHELQEVVPECVVGAKDAVDAEGNPQYQGIDTSFLVATLTAAIQELNAKFEAYKEAHP